MKKILPILVVLALAAATFLFFFFNQNRIVAEITLSSDDSPLINELYSIGQLQIVEGDVSESLFEGAKLFIQEELTGEDRYSPDFPSIEVGDQLYRVVLKNEFITQEERLTKTHGGYLWFGGDDAGGYPIMKFDSI